MLKIKLLLTYYIMDHLFFMRIFLFLAVRFLKCFFFFSKARFLYFFIHLYRYAYTFFPAGFSRYYDFLHKSFMEGLAGITTSPIASQYLKSRAVLQHRDNYPISMPDRLDYMVRLKLFKKDDSAYRQGDLLVLKRRVSQDEKGVLLLQYNTGFQRFFSLFDAESVAKEYYLVLEPSTWGYQDLDILMFSRLDTGVFVQSQYENDRAYIQGLRMKHFVSVHLGAGDWFNPEQVNFNDSDGKKSYDLIYVASWHPKKKHEFLFSHLQKCPEVEKFALVGYPTETMDQASIRRLLGEYGLLEKCDIFENVSHSRVVELLMVSKSTVMLSRAEGANRAIYEALFCDVPILLYDQNVGVDRRVISPQTGVMCSRDDLHKKLTSVIKNYKNYSPRKWAMENTGYLYATKYLNNIIKEYAANSCCKWTCDIAQKCNNPNSSYLSLKDGMLFDDEYVRLKQYIRKGL